ncbi:MAG: uroporphyrinogen decarboxylase family protein [bacterium]
MTREQRALNVLKGLPVDYLPSQITLADRTKDGAVAKALGLSGAEALDDYLDNHLVISLTLCDTPLFYRNDKAKMAELEAKGYAKVDTVNGIVYDSWGMGVKIGEEGFFACYHPLQGNAVKNKMAAPFLPDGFDRAILDMPFAEAARAYQAPDANRPDNLDDMLRDLKANAHGEHLVVPSGYLGIYERSYCLMGFEEFMMESVTDPESVAILMDKITDYKVATAKRKVAAGFKCGHHGDDLGCQVGTLVSPSQFHDLIKPRIARHFKVFKDAGLPVMMHSCGDITPFLPDLIEIGLDMIEPVQPCMGLERIKQLFGDQLSFWGGIDTQEILPHGTPAEVAAETKRVISILGKGGRYIIAPSQEVMVDVPAANIAAMLATIKAERGNM